MDQAPGLDELFVLSLYCCHSFSPIRAKPHWPFGLIPIDSELFPYPKHDYTKTLLDVVLMLSGNYAGIYECC